MAIDFDQGNVVVEGVSSEVIVNSLKGAGIEGSKIAQFMGYLYLGATGVSAPPAFRFATIVEEVDPACAVTYQRGFAHIDWFDGDSRVQAGMTPEELGFNARFHAIENEFDALSQELADLGTCVALIRKDLFGVAREMEARITDLQNQIFSIRQRLGPEEPIRRFDEFKDVGVIGTTKVGDKNMLVLRSADRFEMVDLVTATPNIGFIPGGGFTDPIGMVQFVSQFEEVVGGNPEIEATIVRGATAEELGEAFGDIVVSSEGEQVVTFSDVLSTFEADRTFESTADLTGHVAEAAASTLGAAATLEAREELLVGAARDRDGAALLNSRVDSLAVVDEAAGAALAGSGLNTVGRLAGASQGEVHDVLEGAGIVVDAARLSDIVGAARVARAIR